MGLIALQTLPCAIFNIYFFCVIIQKWLDLWRFIIKNFNIIFELRRGSCPPVKLYNTFLYNKEINGISITYLLLIGHAVNANLLKNED